MYKYYFKKVYIYVLLLLSSTKPSSREFFRDVKHFYNYTVSKNKSLSIFFIKLIVDLDVPTKVNLHTLLLFKSKGNKFLNNVEDNQVLNLTQVINITKSKDTKLQTKAAPMAIKLSRSKDKILLFEDTMSAVLNFIEYGTLIEIFFEDNTYRKITRIEYAINSGMKKGVIYDPIDEKSILIESIDLLFQLHRRKVNKFEIDVDSKNINFVDNTFFSTTVNDISMINSKLEKHSHNNSVLEDLDSLKNEIKSPKNDQNLSKYSPEKKPLDSILKRENEHSPSSNDHLKKKTKFTVDKPDILGLVETGNKKTKKSDKAEVIKKPNKSKMGVKAEEDEREKKKKEKEDIENNTSILGFALISILIGLEFIAVIILIVYMQVSKSGVKVNSNVNNVDMVLEEFELNR